MGARLGGRAAVGLGGDDLEVAYPEGPLGTGGGEQGEAQKSERDGCGDRLAGAHLEPPFCLGCAGCLALPPFFFFFWCFCFFLWWGFLTHLPCLRTKPFLQL